MRALSGLAALVFAAGLAVGAPAASQETSGTDKAEAEQKLSAQLDDLLLGAWAEIEGGAQAKLSPQTLLSAVTACTTPVKIERLNVHRDAEKTLPKPTQLMGTMTYYRTKKGLQRFEAGNGTLLLLDDIAMEERETGPAIWRLSGKGLAIRLAFATRKSPKRDLVLMFEDNRLFFRCPQPDTETDTGRENEG